MNKDLPSWLNPQPWLHSANTTGLTMLPNTSDVSLLANLLQPVSEDALEEMAQRAKSLTQKHFGKTISLYAPLYLSNYCSGGCAYCGFASDREQDRKRLSKDQVISEIHALKERGIDEILLLTGARCPEADLDYLCRNTELAAKHFNNVTIEAFAMTEEEYRLLVGAGCTGLTLYQETYDPVIYDKLHRWGKKKDYMFRLEAPARALSVGMRTVGMGVLLGLADPLSDAICLFRHVRHLQKNHWQGGISVSFPRICSQTGDYHAGYTISDNMLAQIIFAFRISLPDVPLVLSTREKAMFRDGIAGIGISKMSVASKTTVGGYSSHNVEDDKNNQFKINDNRNVDEFCAALRSNGLEPIFKNWDATLRYVGA